MGRLDGFGRRVGQLAVTIGGQPGCQLEHAAQVQRCGLGNAAVGRHHQLVAQKTDNVLGSLGPELQPDRGQLAALFQQLAHHIAEVDVMVHHALVHRDVGIAGNPEQAALLHIALAENQRRIVGDQLLNEGKPGDFPFLDIQDPLKLAVDGNDAVIDAIGLIGQLHNKIGFLVAQEGERMPLVHNLRAENREHLVLVVALPAALLLLVQGVEVHLFIATVGQLIHQMLVVFVALGLQLLHLGHDGRQLLRGSHVGHLVGLVVLEQRLVVQRPHPDHEKFVQVAAVDAGKFQALAQRYRLFLGEGKHAAVEIQPAEFPVNENRIRRFCHDVLLIACCTRPGAMRQSQDRPTRQPCAVRFL